jgi:myo-inositol 2-dehydrogenase/D-chiro-inositol 1-dehydrogenase
MVREPDATMQPPPQDNQLMSKHRVLGLKSQLRLEWRGQDGQNETEQPDHSASLGDSSSSSTQDKVFGTHRYTEAYSAEIGHFIDCLGNGAAPMTSFADRVEALRIADAAQQSVETGKPVRLEQT